MYQSNNAHSTHFDANLTISGLLSIGPDCQGSANSKSIYSWPSVSTGSASVDSTNRGLKIFREKNFRKLQKAKLEFAAHHQPFALYLQLLT